MSTLNRARRYLAWIAAMVLTVAASFGSLGAQQSAERAVLFFSPTCPHCQRVINQDLPVFFDTFGGAPRLLMDQQVPRDDRDFFLLTNGQLEILLVNASRPRGNDLYAASMERVPGNAGVPRLVFGDTVLIGDVDIPGRFPQLVRTAHGAGGMDWPQLAGLADVLDRLTEAQPEVQESGAEPEPAAAPDSMPQPVDSGGRTQPTPPPDSTPTEEVGRPEPSPAADTATAGGPMRDTTGTALGPAGIQELEAVSREDNASAWEKYGRDPVGSTLALAVLCGMVGLLSWTPMGIRRGGEVELGWSVLVLAVAGIGVAGYLTYIETTGTTAVCGPVGDCNTVQQSAYATVFGVPVAVLGLAGYVAVVIAWTVTRFQAGTVVEWARLTMFAVTLIGTSFSVYLTFLEPFVIGATCMWCLTSAILIAALLWRSVGSVRSAWDRIHGVPVDL